LAKPVSSAVFSAVFTAVFSIVNLFFFRAGIAAKQPSRGAQPAADENS
jgi:hypothetical protein